MRGFLTSSYFKEFQKQQEKLSDECKFKPDLNLTRRYNGSIERHPAESAEEFFNRTIKWKEQSKNKLE
jgi:hypothetical protein